MDDEPGIRMTLPAILEQKGFEAKTAASVPEAIEIINKQKFDVLISDLNIGQPSDGFTVVSVMRRVQPEAVTFILTGFPDFESALKAIRNQVDDYLTKPADISMLVATLERKLTNRHPARSIPTQRAPELLLERLEEVLHHWLVEVQSHPELKASKVAAKASHRAENSCRRSTRDSKETMLFPLLILRSVQRGNVALDPRVL